jgi:hypothetical protein
MHQFDAPARLCKKDLLLVPAEMVVVWQNLTRTHFNFKKQSFMITGVV